MFLLKDVVDFDFGRLISDPRPINRRGVNFEVTHCLRRVFMCFDLTGASCGSWNEERNDLPCSLRGPNDGLTALLNQVE